MKRSEPVPSEPVPSSSGSVSLPLWVRVFYWSYGAILSVLPVVMAVVGLQEKRWLLVLAALPMLVFVLTAPRVLIGRERASTVRMRLGDPRPIYRRIVLDALVGFAAFGVALALMSYA